MMLSIYSALGFAALLFLLLPSKRLPTRYRWPLAVLLLALTQLPVEGVTLAGHWRASVGDLAVTTTLLLLTLAWRRLRALKPLLLPRLRTPLRWFAPFALLFYPLSMGASSWDPYRLGYTPDALLLVVFALMLWSWYRRAFALALALAAATLVFAVDGLSSHNYWDYLFDPILAVFALNLLVRRALQKLRYRRRNAQRQREAAVG